MTINTLDRAPLRVKSLPNQHLETLAENLLCKNKVISAMDGVQKWELLLLDDGRVILSTLVKGVFVRALRVGLGMAVLGALGGLVMPSTASAASIVCPANVGFSQPIWDNVTPNLGPGGCEIGSVNNDSEATVNALDSMFNITTWEELARVDLTTTSGVLCATVVAGCDNSSGWSFSGPAITSLMLVLKGGVAAVPDDYVGYLIPVGTTLINFTSPFSNPNNGNAKDVSHFTLYASRDVTTVPEPASLMLLGTGIAGLASRLRRRQPR